MTEYTAFLSARVRLGLLPWLFGLVGVVVVTVEDVPRLLEGQVLPVPLWVLVIVSITQSSVFLGLAVWAGVELTPQVGLRAPAFEAAVTAHSVVAGLRQQILPGLVAGALGGGLLLAVGRCTPTALAMLQERFAPALPGSLLYGGVTEELLIRWGVMTTILWLMWRFLHRRSRAPGLFAVSISILASALVFGVGHLPAVAALPGHISAEVALFVVAANTVFGIVFGCLFWRFGLECAMIAHATTHLVSYLMTQF